MASRVRNRSNGDVTGRRLRGAVLYLTLAIVVAAVICSIGFVVYTAWLHDIRRGIFALVFGVMSAKIAFNWFVWRNEDDDVFSDVARDGRSDPSRPSF